MEDNTQTDMPLNEETSPIIDEDTPTGSTTQDAEALRRQVQANLEGWQRARAEFSNYKKRIEKELQQAVDNGQLNSLTEILPIMDDFSRALDNIPNDLKANPWVMGTSLILKKFDKVLEQYAVQEIDPVGQPFDPHLHSAIGMDESTSKFPSGTVTATLQKGYRSGERVLRPALVRVAN